jgi:transposase
VLNVEDWAEIRRLHRAEGVPIKVIARRLKISRNTVRKALAAAEPPSYHRATKGSIVDAVEPQIRVLLAETPSMPVTVIAERIGWDRSLTVLKDRLRELRPLFMPPDPAQRTEYLPSELAQCDLWFPPPVRFTAGLQRPARARRSRPSTISWRSTMISGWLVSRSSAP